MLVLLQRVKELRFIVPIVLTLNETKRLITVEWDEERKEGKYEVKLYILAQDRSFLISDIVTIINQCKAGLVAVNSTVNEDKITASTLFNGCCDGCGSFTNCYG